MKKILPWLLLYTSTSYGMFCPTNLNQIDIGDTIEKVTQQCGKPSSEKKVKQSVSVPQEWTYYLEENPIVPGTAVIGTLKTTFAFEEDQIVNVSVNGIGVGATAICGPNIQLGDSMEKVKSACGKPVIVNESKAAADAKPVELIEWKYDGPPTYILTFEDGKLKSRS